MRGVVRGYIGGSHQAHGGPVPLSALPYLERLAPDSSGNTGSGMIDLGSKETAVSTATSRANRLLRRLLCGYACGYVASGLVVEGEIRQALSPNLITVYVRLRMFPSVSCQFKDSCTHALHMPLGRHIGLTNHPMGSSPRPEPGDYMWISGSMPCCSPGVPICLFSLAMYSRPDGPRHGEPGLSWTHMVVPEGACCRVRHGSCMSCLASSIPSAGGRMG